MTPRNRPQFKLFKLVKENEDSSSSEDETESDGEEQNDEQKLEDRSEKNLS